MINSVGHYSRNYLNCRLWLNTYWSSLSLALSLGSFQIAYLIEIFPLTVNDSRQLCVLTHRVYCAAATFIRTNTFPCVFAAERVSHDVLWNEFRVLVDNNFFLTASCERLTHVCIAYTFSFRSIVLSASFYSIESVFVCSSEIQSRKDEPKRTERINRNNKMQILDNTLIQFTQ